MNGSETTRFECFRYTTAQVGYAESCTLQHMHGMFICICMLSCIHRLSCYPWLIVDKVKGDDKVEADDVAIPMDQTHDASKLGRQVVPGESSSSSSSSSSDDQAEHVFSGMSAHCVAYVPILLHDVMVTFGDAGMQH